jgi:hypothetical protein
MMNFRWKGIANWKGIDAIRIWKRKLCSYDKKGLSIGNILKNSAIDYPQNTRLENQVLLAYSLKKERNFLFANFDHQITEEQYQKYLG